MTTEQKFHAAVNVIRSLPKNGSYQPSNELMLRFYSYFKQATIGSCEGSRPAFWDIVGRAKYDAWKKLGDMSKNEAMARYVDELHSIVETMSYSDKVANFLEAPTDELEAINMEDLELIAGDVMERVRSQPNSPLGSREVSPVRLGSKSSSVRSSCSPSPDIPADESDDEYIDTIENPEPRKFTSISDCLGTLNEPIQHQHISRARTRSTPGIDISQEISKAVQSLRSDIGRLTDRMDSIENASKTITQSRRKGMFGGMSMQLIVFIVTWPFVAHLIMNRYLSRRT
ncbi:unnamed protein product [Phaedon cochleariae]|uniref:ACB domain-containing protein n=1 Tax=Phaedon cochleariae TaxID=80249 RepID=A0A9P0DC37_PHACE|nr:unnamed protein product [Phaedon cochleariae]